MFLFERVFGFGAYMLILLFVCMLLVKTDLNCKPILNFYLVCLCVMAFFYKPYVTADLYRIYSSVELFGKMDFADFWKNYALGSSTPMARFLYWCIGKSGINALLPTLAALICYTLIFKIILKTQQIFSVSKENVAYVLFFVMTTSIYISVIGGIRMMLTLSMIAFCFFRGTVEKKTTVFDWFIYGVSVFLHSMALAVIAICVVATVFDSRKSFARRMAFFIPISVMTIIFAFNFENILFNAFEKAEEFVFGKGYYDVWEYIMGVLIMVLLVILTCEYWSMVKEEELTKIQSYNAAAIISLLVAMVFCFDFSIFYRFGGQLAVILSIPMMLVILEKSSDRPSRVFGFLDIRSVFLIFSVFIAAISCTRGSLSSLKFFEL